MVLGVLGLIILCPVVQWLELGTKDNASFSSIALPPVAIMALCGLVLAALLAALVKRVRPQADFILLYAMFLVGATVCSTGLVRPIYGHMVAIMDELLQRKVETVRTGYKVQDATVFPKLTTELPPEIFPTDPDKAKRERERNLQYEPLTQFVTQLRRDPKDQAPKINHADPRYDLGVKVKQADGTEKLEERGVFEALPIQMGWWWRERFLRDTFGGIKKDVEAWRDIEKGASNAPLGALPGYPQEVIDRVKQNPPSGMAQWFSDSVLGSVKASHEKVVLTPAGQRESVKVTQTIPWNLWLWPVVTWTIFALMVIAFLICLAEVLRRIWLRIENLPMPLVEVPDGAMSLMPGTRGRGAQFSPLILVGLAIGLAYFSALAWKHFKLPGGDSIPNFYMIDLTPMLRDPPYKYIGGAQLWFSPLLIAIGCLISLEVSRSIWSIYFIAAVALMVLGSLGIAYETVTPPQQVVKFAFRNYPFWDDQLAGAMIVLSTWLLWVSRSRLWDIFSAIWRPVDARKVGQWYIHPKVLPFALLGLMIAMPVYAWMMGVNSFWFLLMLFGLFTLFVIAAARLRAETGLLIAPAIPSMHRYSVMFGAGKTFGEAGVVGNSFFWLSNSLVTTLLPAQLELMSLAERRKVSLRRMAGGMMLAAIVALGISMPMAVFWQYSMPGGMSTPNDVGFGGAKDSMYIFYRFSGKGLDQGQIETVRVVATAIGGAIMLGLLAARTFLLGFPFHPIGYVVVAASFGAGVAFNPQMGTNIIWGPILLAWLIKSSIYKIGGTELFTRLLPVFRGVILGHLVAMVIWAIARPMINSHYSQDFALFFTW